MTRRADKRTVSTKKKAQGPSPWIESLSDDAKPLLQKLRSQNWKTDHALSLLQEPLREVISSYYFSTQHRWGLQPDPEEIRHLSKDFLQWMEKSDQWKECWQSCQDWEGPWPLKYLLSRYFIRFLPTQQKRKESGRHPSGERAWLEMSSINHISSELSEGMLKAFSSLTQNLPPLERLIYELHLEGMLNNEIAWLLQLEESNVIENISNAKGMIQNFALDGGQRREGS